MDKTYDLTIKGQKNTFEVKGLTMNGTNYVSDTQVDTSAWPSIFSFEARDENGLVTEQHEHSRLIQQEQYDWDNNRYYLAFGAVSEEELLRAKIAAMEEANTNTEMALCELYETIIGGA